MKYIRTIDGIQALYIDEFTEYGKEYYKNCKIADTIEELCDEFVLDHSLFSSNCKTLYHSFEKAKNGIKKHNDDAHELYPFVIYGAIWTDKGLIYIAKMNDKGELELL